MNLPAGWHPCIYARPAGWLLVKIVRRIISLHSSTFTVLVLASFEVSDFGSAWYLTRPNTAAPDELPAMSKFMFKYIMMQVVMPLQGMIHSLDKGAKRFVDGITKELFESGRFCASYDGKVVGQVIDQSTIFPDLSNVAYQDNAYKAIHRFIK